MMFKIWKTAAALGATIMSVAALSIGQPARSCCNSPGVVPVSAEPEFQDLPGPGKKCWIGEVEYFVYEFATAPKMGTAILRIELFDKSGAKITDLDVGGQSDMPEMRGAHDSGAVPFKLNKKGDYLMPVNIVMPGEWEVRLTFSRNKIDLFRGRLTFKV